MRVRRRAFGGERTNRDSEGQVQNGFQNCPTTDATFPCAGGQVFGPRGVDRDQAKMVLMGALFKAGGRRARRAKPGRKVCQKARPCLCRRHAAAASQAAGLLRPCATRRIGAPLSAPRNEWRGENKHIHTFTPHTGGIDRARGAGMGRPAIPPTETHAQAV